MNDKKINLLWSISLIMISFSSLTISVTNAFDAEMPDAIAIILCLLILAAVCTLVYTSLKKWQKSL